MPETTAEIRARFVVAFLSGETGSLERCVASVPEVEREAVLADLLAHELAIRVARGEQPSTKDYADRFPTYRSVIERVVHSASGDSASVDQHTRNTPQSKSLQSTLIGAEEIHDLAISESHHSLADGQDPTQIGRFRIVRTLGSGGFGLVYLAYDPSLDRMVALKVLKAIRRDQSDTRERFLREGRAAARLRHPNIVAVFEASSGVAQLGSDAQEVAYIASEYVEGHTLRQALKRGTTWTPKDAAILVSAIADAIGYAHQKGITHRDIKPENIIVSIDGQPQILDFGLASFDDAATELTGQHEIFGTPQYLSPEQLTDGSHQAGPASDVWATGIVFYELLTGRRPFENLSRVELLTSIPTGPIAAPRTMNPAIPKDLNAICLKALSRNVDERFRDGRVLHQDLERFLVDIPVLARPLGPLGRIARWVRRQPAVALLAGLVVLATTAGAGVSTVFAMRAQEKAVEARQKTQLAETESKRATENSVEAKAESHRAELSLYRARILLGQNYWHRGDAPRVREELQMYRPDSEPQPPVKPGWEWNFLWRLVNKEAIVCEGHSRGINDIRISPDGTRVATAGIDGTLRLWDASDGREIAVSKNIGGLNQVRFHPAENTILAAGFEGEILICSAEDLSAERTIQAHIGSIYQLEFAVDNRHLVTSGKDQRVRIWNYETGEKVAEAGGKQFGEWQHRIAVSPDGGTVAFEGSGVVTLLNANDGSEIRHYEEGHKLRSEILNFSPNGKWLFSSGSSAPRFYRLDRPEDAPIAWPTESRVSQLTWAGNSEQFVTQEYINNGPPLNVHVWKISDDGALQRESRLGVAVRDVQATMFTPDGKSVITGGDNGLVQVWSSSDGARDEFFPGGKGELNCLAVSTDGSSIYSGGRHDPTMRGWKVGTGRQTSRHKVSNLRALATTFDSDSGVLMASGWQMDAESAVVLSLPDLDEVSKFPPQSRGREKFVNTILLSPDGTRLAIGESGMLRIIDRHDPTKSVFFDCSEGVESIAFDPNGEKLLVGYGDGNAGIHDGATAKRISAISCGHRTTLQVAYHPDGSQFATAGFDGTVKVWDAATRKTIRELEWGGWYVFSLAYSADGRQLAAGSHIPVVKVWDTETFAEIATLKGHASRVNSISFHPDGTRVATSGWDGSARIWDCETWQELCVIEVGAGTVFSCNFSPDGNYLALACEDGTVHVCDGRPVDDAM